MGRRYSRRAQSVRARELAVLDSPVRVSGNANHAYPLSEWVAQLAVRAAFPRQEVEGLACVLVELSQLLPQLETQLLAQRARLCACEVLQVLIA